MKINNIKNTVTVTLPLTAFSEIKKESGTFEWYTREKNTAKPVMNTANCALKIIGQEIRAITSMSPISDDIAVTRLYELMRRQAAIKELASIFARQDKAWGGYGLFTKLYNYTYSDNIHWHYDIGSIYHYQICAETVMADMAKHRDGFLNEIAHYKSVSLYAVATHKLLDACVAVWIIEGRKSSSLFNALMRALSGMYKNCETMRDITDYLLEESISCNCLNVEIEEIDEPIYVSDFDTDTDTAETILENEA